MAEIRPFTAASFNHFLGEHKLMGVRCSTCGKLYTPPRAICPACHGGAMEWVELSGRGRVAAFTAISIAPTMMIEEGYGRDNPYCTGVVELEEGAKVSARLLGFDARNPALAIIGMPVKVEFLDRGEGENARTYLAFNASAGG